MNLNLNKVVKDIIREEINDLSAYDKAKRSFKRGGGRDTDVKTEFNENFWKWFEGSKVVNPDGSPKLMYHGTTEDFDAFEKGSFGFHFGTYEQAKDITIHNRGQYMKTDAVDSAGNPKYELTYGNGSNMMLVYLSIKNPVEIQDPGADEPLKILSSVEKYFTPDETLHIEDLLTNTGDGTAEKFARKEIIRILLSHGYDGCFYENEVEGLYNSDDHQAWIAFKPEQIKSATGNNGEYSSSPDITKESLKEQIIIELTTLTEGVGDKAADRMFNIPDPNIEMNKKALHGLKYLPQDDTQAPGDNQRGEFAGKAEGFDVYKNPKSLKDFDANVRAISDKNGDLYVAQLNGFYFHGDIGQGVGLGNPYNERKHVTWHRAGDTDTFGVSISYMDALNYHDEYYDIVTELFEAVRKKNPNFKFLPYHWLDIKENGIRENGYTEYIASQGATNEGVGDKYAANAFGIPDPNVAMDLKATSVAEKPYKTMAIELPAWIDNGDGGRIEYTPVFLNPKSLDGFQSNVRAIGDVDGNLFVAQLDGNFVHGNMAKELGLTQNDVVGVKLYQQMNKFQLLHRVGYENSFGLADSSAGYTRQNEESKKNSIAMLRKIKAKNPQFEYYPEYYQNVETYDTDPIDANGNDKYDEETYDEDNIGDDNNMRSADLVSNPDNSKDFDEGVADKYAEREFNIPDQNSVSDVKAMSYMQREMEKPIAIVNSSNIYKNPKSLANFDKDVRAIIDSDGNLYVMQKDIEVMHGGMGRAIGFNSYVYDKKDEFGLLHRVDNTNSFGLGDTGASNMYSNPEAILNLLKKAKRKNPQYDFYREYFKDVKPGMEKVKEGVADKYAEREFNILDTGKVSDVRASSYMQKEKEEPVGRYGNTHIYKNPESLENFDSNVRAVAYMTGDLYVAQENSGILHGEVAVGAKLTNDSIDVYYGDKYYYALLHRIGTSNKFGFGDTGIDNFKRPGFREKIIDILRKTKEKNSQYEFYLDYYQKVNAKTPEIDSYVNAEIAEGVADKYADREFNIPDPNVAMDKIAMSGIKDSNMGELAGIVKHRWKDMNGNEHTSEVNVYMNPKTLQNFDEDVRAITDSNGNLFIGQLDSDYYHGELALAVRAMHPEYKLSPAYGKLDKKILWHRVGLSREFGISVSYEKHLKTPEGMESAGKLLEAAQRKNPQFEFALEYWEEM